MTTARLTEWDWLTQAPRETLGLKTLDRSPTWAVLLPILSAAASHTLAETVMTWSDVSERFTLAQWMGIQAVSVFLSITLAAIVTLNIARLFSTTPLSTRAWLSGVAVAVIPFHLTLPAALLAQAFGENGMIVYELIKLLVIVSVLRRWLWATNAVFGWPLWAGLLAALIPLTITFVVATTAVLIGVAAVLFALAGALA